MRQPRRGEGPGRDYPAFKVAPAPLQLCDLSRRSSAPGADAWRLLPPAKREISGRTSFKWRNHVGSCLHGEKRVSHCDRKRRNILHQPIEECQFRLTLVVSIYLSIYLGCFYLSIYRSIDLSIDRSINICWGHW